MKVIIPTAFRKHTDGKKNIDVTGSNVGDVISGLIQAYPNLRDSLYTPADELVQFVGVFVNEKNIRDLEGVNTSVDDRDELLLVPAIAGG
ncbi:MoaD/ThiS family protein [Stieleria sp. JC731]|nr:MoaD/ThiS family protein [Stieleria sp. JC731]MCC9600513.1 MoaD/ThiS family protein [Stieleria sp. JC731]